MADISIEPIEAHGDSRGILYGISIGDIPKLNHIAELHFGTISPGAVRGNHYHVGRTEWLIIAWTNRWTLAWAYGDSRTETREFEGNGSVLVTLEEGVAHSIENTGTGDLILLALSDKPPAADGSDTVYRQLV